MGKSQNHYFRSRLLNICWFDTKSEWKVHLASIDRHDVLESIFRRLTWVIWAQKWKTLKQTGSGHFWVKISVSIYHQKRNLIAYPPVYTYKGLATEISRQAKVWVGKHDFLRFSWTYPYTFCSKILKSENNVWHMFSGPNFDAEHEFRIKIDIA